MAVYQMNLDYMVVLLNLFYIGPYRVATLHPFLVQFPDFSRYFSQKYY